MPMRNIHCSKLLQFAQSQPLKPFNITSLETSSPQARVNLSGFPGMARSPANRNLLASPRPLTPSAQFRFPYQFPEPSPNKCSNIGYPYYMQESRFPFQNADLIPVAAPPVMWRSKSKLGEESEDIEEIIKEILRLYERLPVSVREVVSSEIRKSEIIDTTSRCRGLEETTSFKLERFKVRTVVAGEVVKVEEESKGN